MTFPYYHKKVIYLFIINFSFVKKFYYYYFLLILFLSASFLYCLLRVGWEGRESKSWEFGSGGGGNTGEGSYRSHCCWEMEFQQERSFPICKILLRFQTWPFQHFLNIFKNLSHFFYFSRQGCLFLIYPLLMEYVYTGTYNNSFHCFFSVPYSISVPSTSAPPQHNQTAWIKFIFICLIYVFYTAKLLLVIKYHLWVLYTK